MLSALKKVGFALLATLMAALHAIVSAAFAWLMAKVLIIATKIGVWAILQSGKEGPTGWAWIEISDLWTYIPVGVAGVLGAMHCLIGMFRQGIQGYDYFWWQSKAWSRALPATFLGGYGAFCGGFAGLFLGVLIRLALLILRIPIGPPADDLVHTIPGVALGGVGFLIGFCLGVISGSDASWSDLFSGSGGGYSGGGGGGGGGSSSLPSPSPTSYSSPPVETPSYNPAFPNGPNGGPAFPTTPAPDWTVADQARRVREQEDRWRWEHDQRQKS